MTTNRLMFAFKLCNYMCNSCEPRSRRDPTLKVYYCEIKAKVGLKRLRLPGVKKNKQPTQSEFSPLLLSGRILYIYHNFKDKLFLF